MGSYTYEVRVKVMRRIGGRKDAPDKGTVAEVMEAVNADAVLAQPGYLEVSGSIDEDTILEAAETMRGVLNRTTLTLKSHGFMPVSEGWDINEEEGE